MNVTSYYENMCSIITLLFFYEAELRGIYSIEI